jgi:tether containing UBX domain for GLUT4
MASTIPESQPLIEPEAAPSGLASASAPAPQAAGGSSTSALAQLDFKVYAPANIQAAPLPSLSDEYFTPNAFELKAAQATLSARTSALVNAPLAVRAHREKAEQAKKDRWPQVCSNLPLRSNRC